MTLIAKIIFALIASAAIIPLHSDTPLLEPNSSVISPQGESYTVILPLGAGSNGAVFLAKDKDERPFAIKLVQAKEELLEKGYPAAYVNAIYASDGLCLMSLWEFQKASRLNHPNILKIYDCFCAIDARGFNRTYLVMDYINGKTLDVTPRGSLSRQQALKIAYQLVDALKFALTRISHKPSDQLDSLLHHLCSQNSLSPLVLKLCEKSNYPLVHQDLHSLNIMIDENQELKLIDLDSFDELLPNEDKSSERLNQDHFTYLFHTIKEILACGEFDELELDIQENAMSEILQKPSYQETLNQPMSLESLEFYSEVFEDLLTLFNPHFSENH
jgi:serine/threonine protein kinase